MSNPSQNSGAQVIHYNRNQVYPSPSCSTIDTLNPYHAHQIAHNSQITGNNISLIIKGKPIQISQATVNAFCADFLRNHLAESNSLTGPLLEKLERQQKITIHYRETKTGDVCKRYFSSKAPKVAISAGIAAALSDFSQFRHIIEDFFNYTYSKSITSYNASSTHYYANDQYTVTGCYLFRYIYKKQNALKVALMHGKLVDISYETQCYLFTFKVAQAAKFLERHLTT